MSVTQKEIAQKLNIAQSQVARALSGNPVVSAKTRARIEAAAREMGYDPDANSAARSMILKRHGKRMQNGVIAVMFPPMGGASPQYVPYYAPILSAMEEAAAERKMDICMCPLRPEELPRMIRDRNVDGVIALGYWPAHATAIRALGLPIVMFHDNYEGMHSIMPDERDGARQATRHLLELGHRRIAFLGVMTHVTAVSALRLEGYRDAMREYGVEIRDEWIDNTLPISTATYYSYCDKCRAEGDNCGACAACVGWARLMEKSGGIGRSGQLPFTALVCHNDPVAMGVVTNARKAGVVVPDDLSIVGFDNISFEYNFSPRITSIDLPRSEMGRSAVDMVCDVLQNEAGTEEARVYEHQVLPVSLALHQSTQSPAG